MLAKMDLVVRRTNGSMANKKIVEAFLPFRAPQVLAANSAYNHQQPGVSSWISGLIVLKE
jgi:hypothetical protein